MNDVPHLALLQRHVASHPHPLLFATVSGAHLYGFESADSDVDLRGVHALPPRAFLGLEPPSDETISHTTVDQGIEVDLVTHDARKFFRMLLQRNGYVLEQLLSPLIVLTSPWHEELRALAPACLTRHHAHHYRGFARTTWTTVEKAPALKPLLYTYRVLLTGIHLMRSREMLAHLPSLNRLYPQEAVAELIERKRTGREHDTLPPAEVLTHRPRIDALLSRLDQEQQTSVLPLEPTAQAALDDLVRRVRS